MAATTRRCSAADRAGRLAKARQFAAAAELLDAFADDADELSDAYVTLSVHAGIAAADVVCCDRLGVHASGQDHAAAAALLDTADSRLGKDLRRLLGLKTKAGYSATAAGPSDRKTAGRAMARLVDAASAML